MSSNKQRVIPIEQGKPICMITDSFEDMLILCIEEGYVLIFKIPDFTLERISQEQFNHISCIAKGLNESIWIGGQIIYKINQNDLKIINTFNHHDDTVIGLKIYNNELISASEDNTVKSLNTHNDIVTTLYSHNSSIICFEMNERQGLILTFCSDLVLQLFDCKKKTLIKSIELDSKIWSLKFIPETNNFVSGNHDGMLSVWETDSLTQIKNSNIHDSRIKSIDYNSEKKVLVTSSFDQTVVLTNFDDLKFIKKISEHSDWVRGVLIVLNKFVVSFGDDQKLNIVEVWEGGKGGKSEEKPKSDKSYWESFKETCCSCFLGKN